MNEIPPSPKPRKPPGRHRLPADKHTRHITARISPKCYNKMETQRKPAGLTRSKYLEFKIKKGPKPKPKSDVDT